MRGREVGVSSYRNCCVVVGQPVYNEHMTHFRSATYLRKKYMYDNNTLEWGAQLAVTTRTPLDFAPGP